MSSTETILRALMADSVEKALKAHHIEDSSSRLDAYSSTWIKFKSEADALVASWWLGEYLADHFGASIPLNTFDDMLRSLKHSNAHTDELEEKENPLGLLLTDKQKSEISFESGIDILNTIAESRGTTALKRTVSKITDPPATQPIPDVVLDLVTQVLEAGCPQREHFTDVTPELEALKAMTLVHRSWIIPARRILSRTKLVDGPYELYDFLRSPCSGPWTRFLCYKGEVRDLETSMLLIAAIRRCQGLRVLKLNSVLILSEHQLLNEIAGLRKLEMLDLGYSAHFKSNPSPHLFDICKILPKMGALKSLTLRDMVCRDEEKLPSTMHKLSPCPNLIEVKLYGYCYRNYAYDHISDFREYHHLGNLATIDCIAWLFKPRRDYSVSSTFIDMDDVYEGMGSSTTLNKHGAAILPALPGITSLEIVKDDLYRGTDLLSRCENVVHVNLESSSLSNLYRAGKIDFIPKSVKSLCLKVDDYNNSDAIKVVVQSLPNLRSFRLLTKPVHGTCFKVSEVESFCLMRCISFSEHSCMNYKQF